MCALGLFVLPFYTVVLYVFYAFRSPFIEVKCGWIAIHFSSIRIEWMVNQCCWFLNIFSLAKCNARTSRKYIAIKMTSRHLSTLWFLHYCSFRIILNIYTVCMYLYKHRYALQNRTIQSIFVEHRASEFNIHSREWNRNGSFKVQYLRPKFHYDQKNQLLVMVITSILLELFTLYHRPILVCHTNFHI